MPKLVYEVLWTDIASQDLLAVLDFIALRNPDRAKELFHRIPKKIETVSRFPLRARLVPELMAIGVDIYRELIIDPYRVLFRIRGQKVIIMGFFDGRRNLGDVLYERITRS